MAAAEADRAPITSRAVWHASDVAERAEWTLELTDDQRNELASTARAAGRAVGDLAIDDAPLPSLAG
jgi:hypothetical protein